MNVFAGKTIYNNTKKYYYIYNENTANGQQEYSSCTVKEKTMLKTIKRNEFKKVIRTLSCWKTGRKDYRLPSGDKCSQYIKELIKKVLDEHDLMIDSNGDIIGCTYDLQEDKYMPFFAPEEECDLETQEKRIGRLTFEFFR